MINPLRAISEYWDANWRTNFNYVFEPEARMLMSAREQVSDPALFDQQLRKVTYTQRWPAAQIFRRGYAIAFFERGDGTFRTWGPLAVTHDGLVDYDLHFETEVPGRAEPIRSALTMFDGRLAALQIAASERVFSDQPRVPLRRGDGLAAASALRPIGRFLEATPIEADDEIDAEED